MEQQPQQWSVHAEFTISHPGLKDPNNPPRTDTVTDDKSVRMCYEWTPQHDGQNAKEDLQQQQYGFQRGNIYFTSTPPRRCSGNDTTTPSAVHNRLGVPDSGYGSDFLSPISAISSVPPTMQSRTDPYNRKCRSTCNIVLTANLQHGDPADVAQRSSCGRTQSLRCQTPSTLSCDRKNFSDASGYYGCGDPWCHHARYGDDFSTGGRRISPVREVCEDVEYRTPKRDVSVQTYDMVNRCTSPMVKMDNLNSSPKTLEKKPADKLKRGRVLRYSKSPRRRSKSPPSTSNTSTKTTSSGAMKSLPRLCRSPSLKNITDITSPTRTKKNRKASPADKTSNSSKPKTIHIDVYCTGTEMESDSSSSSSESSASKTPSTPQTVFESKNLHISHKEAGSKDIPFLLKKEINADSSNIDTLDKNDSEVDDSSTSYPAKSSFSSLGYDLSSVSSFPMSTPYSLSSCTIPGVDSFATTSWKDTFSDFGGLLNSHSSIAPNDSTYFIPKRIDEESEDRGSSKTSENGTASSLLQPTDSFEYANSEDRLRIKRMEKIWKSKIHQARFPSGLTQKLQDDVNKRLSQMKTNKDSDTDISDDDDDEKGWMFIQNMVDTSAHLQPNSSTVNSGDITYTIVPVNASFTIPKSSIAKAFVTHNNHLSEDYSVCSTPPDLSSVSINNDTFDSKLIAQKFGEVKNAVRKPGHHVGPAKNPSCSCNHCQMHFEKSRSRASSVGDGPSVMNWKDYLRELQEVNLSKKLLNTFTDV